MSVDFGISVPCCRDALYSATAERPISLLSGLACCIQGACYVSGINAAAGAVKGDLDKNSNLLARSG